MVDGGDEAFRREQIVFRLHIVLQRQHVRGGEFSSRLQYAVNACRPPWRLPRSADGIRVVVRRDSPVGRGNDSRRRVVNTGQLVEGNVARPLVSIIRATDREAAVAGGSNWDVPGRLIADVAIDNGIDNILSGRVELGKRLAKFFPVLRRVDIEKWHVQPVVECPTQCYLPRVTGNQFADDRPMPGKLHIDRDIRFLFDMNYLAAM